MVLSRDDLDRRSVVYIYRTDDRGRKIKPATVWDAERFARGGDFDLETTMQAELGPGAYQVMIREYKTIVFSGPVGIGPLSRPY